MQVPSWFQCCPGNNPSWTEEEFQCWSFRSRRTKYREPCSHACSERREGFWSNQCPNASLLLVDSRSKAFTLLINQTIIKQKLASYIATPRPEIKVHDPSTCAESLQSCPALCDPINSSLPGSSVHGILQAGILEWVAMPSSRASSQPWDPARVSHISCTDRRVFTTKATWEGSSLPPLGGQKHL